MEPGVFVARDERQRLSCTPPPPPLLPSDRGLLLFGGKLVRKGLPAPPRPQGAAFAVRVGKESPTFGK